MQSDSDHEDMLPLCDIKLPRCTVGQAENSACHLVTYSSGKCSLKLIQEYQLEEQQLISRRSGLQFDETSKICLHHEALFLAKFEHLQRTCCNPFNKKSHISTKSLRVIDFPTADILKDMTKVDVKPGQKLCPACRKELKNRTMASSSSASEHDEGMKVSESVNTSLTALGVSPLKFQKVSVRDSRSYAKRKISQVQSVIGGKIASVGGFDPEDVQAASTSRQCENCLDYNNLLEELKEKLKISSRSEQLQILTLAPSSWSRKKTSTEFGVSERMVKKARKLKTEVGIMSMPGNKRGKKLPDDVKQKVVCFFEDDEFSRICPGKKDCVSVRIAGEKVQKQKRLLLSNIKEMFIAYRDKNGPEIGFSKFCELRPKWCVTVGAAGTHSVCVCTIHQNVKLMLEASPIKEDYKILIEKTVCSLESKDCMLHRCEECPGEEGLKQFLANIFEDCDPEDVIEFKQWVHTDRDTLDTKQLTTEDFIEELTKKISNLSSHHYIAKHQSQHLKSTKENLKPGEFVVLMDFAENYSFVVQDAVQGFHWENSQATLHPFVVYYKSEEVRCISCCIISDCPQHDTIAVHVYITKLIGYLKSIITEIKHINYFSDGSAAQYKNFKNFVNLCHHSNDFHISAEWSFFGTSHGKSPCDGIGGTAKRLAARASLQRPIENQILTPCNLFEFCDEHLTGIKFFFVSNDEVEASRKGQEERFKHGHTVAGTRENHHFVPIDEKQIRVSRVSNDTASFIAHVDRSAEIEPMPVVNLQPGQYVACVYENNWWIGNVCETSVEECDVLINFMHPHGIARSFHWPARKDTCWIPEQQIIANLPVPTATAMGRQYSLPEAVMLSIDEKFHLNK